MRVRHANRNHTTGVFIVLCQHFNFRSATQGSGSNSLFREWAPQTGSSEEQTFAVADIADLNLA